MLVFPSKQPRIRELRAAWCWMWSFVCWVDPPPSSHMAFVQLALPGLQSMVHADGIATILEGVEHIPEGSTVHVQMLP
jgi:hypothetical protein